MHATQCQWPTDSVSMVNNESPPLAVDQFLFGVPLGWFWLRHPETSKGCGLLLGHLGGLSHGQGHSVQ